MATDGIERQFLHSGLEAVGLERITPSMTGLHAAVREDTANRITNAAVDALSRSRHRSVRSNFAEQRSGLRLIEKLKKTDRDQMLMDGNVAEVVSLDVSGVGREPDHPSVLFLP